MRTDHDRIVWFLVIFVAALVLLAALWAARVQARSLNVEQWARDCYGELRLSPIRGGIRAVCLDVGDDRNTPTPTQGPSNTQTPTPTHDVGATPTVTETPSVTPTLVVTPTITPTPEATLPPDREADYCPDIGAAHGTKEPHKLWDGVRGCWYDHAHGELPEDTLFADRPEVYPIGGVHNTPGENENPPGKHKGFFNVYVEDFGGGIEALFCQIHTLGANPAIKEREHSTRCSVLLQGGGYMHVPARLDYGIAHAPYKTNHLPTADDPPVVDFEDMVGHPPYRATCLLADIAGVLLRERCIQQWNSQVQPIVGFYYPKGSHKRIVSQDFFTRDPWDLADPDNPCWLDPDPTCYPLEEFLGGKFNSSEHRIYNLIVNVPDWGDGAHLVDPKGNLDPSCTQEGPECFVLIIDGATPGTYGTDNGAGGVTFDPPGFDWRDGDICFLAGTNTVVPCYQDGSESAGRITYQ